MRGILLYIIPNLPLTPSKGNAKGVCLLRFSHQLRAYALADGAELANCTQLKRRLSPPGLVIGKVPGGEIRESVG